MIQLGVVTIIVVDGIVAVEVVRAFVVVVQSEIVAVLSVTVSVVVVIVD